MSRIIGIDLGTTFSLVSYIDDAGRPNIVINREGKRLTPSVVLIKGKTVLVGEPALNQALTEKDYVVQAIKRSMGDDDYTFQGMTPTQISAEILKKLKSDAEDFLGQKVTECVITVPAYFTDKPRKATKEAGELAGFLIKDLPNEPTAAALYYGTSQMKHGDTVLVYDLGGGTFDATVLLYENYIFTVLASDGTQTLGGQDWTQRIVDMASEAFNKHFGVLPSSDSRLEQIITEACEKAKKALATTDSYEIPLFYKGKFEQFKITSKQFENRTQDLVMHTIEKTESALQKAGISWEKVSRILLVGGSTRLRMVEQYLKQFSSGKELTKYRNVDELVALGAALYTKQQVTPEGQRQITIVPSGPSGIAIASEKSAGIVVVTLKETTTHGLGTVVIDRQGGKVQLVTSVIIKPQSSIPAVASRDDYKTKPHQREVHIPIVQADSDGLDPESCHINKTYRFSGIPERPQPSQIRVTFTYDKDAIIDVIAEDVISNTTLEKETIDFTLPEIIEAPEEIQILLIMDTSGSMANMPIEQAKKEVKKVCDDLKDTPCRLGLIQFGAKVNVVHSLTNDFSKIQRVVDTLYAYNGTPMAEGINLALEEFRNIHGNRVAILISDGQPDNSVEALDKSNTLKREGITLFTISIGTVGAGFLQTIGDAYTQIASSAGLSEAIGQFLQRF